MTSPKTYLLLIFLPYLLLVAIFHLQLQIAPEQMRPRDREAEQQPLIDSNIVRGAVDSEFDKESFHFRDLMIKDSNNDFYASKSDYEKSAIKGQRNYRSYEGAEPYRRAEAPTNEERNGLKLIKVSRTFQNGTRQVQEMVRLLDRDLQRLELEGASESVDPDKSGLFGVSRRLDTNPDNLQLPLTKECAHHLKELEEDTTAVNVFHFVGGIHVMSAYLDTRLPHQPPFVRMIGLMSRGKKPDLYCHFPYGAANDTNTMFATELALFYEMCENHNKDYGGWIISCKVPSVFTDNDKLPCRVIVSEKPTEIGKWIGGVEMPIYTTISPNSTESSAEVNFAICVPPLFGHIPSTTLVEFVELSLLLGASHLVFYVHQVTLAIRKVLEYYQDRGMITVISWDLPVRDKDIWYHGQLLAINDCLYRTMHRFTHVVFNDIDEFLVPHLHETWHGLVGLLESPTNATSMCGFSFQSAFFDPLVNGNSKILYDLESDLRTKTFSQVRTKVMVQPRRIFELGIHHISRPLLERHTKETVDPKVAFIHHYRKCMMDFDPRMKCQVYARDESVSRYIPSLRHNVHQTLWILKELDRMGRRSSVN